MKVLVEPHFFDFPESQITCLILDFKVAAGTGAVLVRHIG